jgi:microcystin-dependent protein
MSSPFVAEIRIFGFNFSPTGWASCDGQLMPISQNTALFSLLGTMYGGDGKSTFGLPNLQGSAPIGNGQGQGLSDRVQGESGGEPSVTLIDSENPAHPHSFVVSTKTAKQRQPPGQQFASGVGVAMYDTNAQPTTTMAPQMLTPAGGSLPHNNMQPYLTLEFCIALQGVFPPRG